VKSSCRLGSGDRVVNINSEEDDTSVPSYSAEYDSEEDMFIGLGSFGKDKMSSNILLSP
jgi:hypothetical protein